MSLGSGSWVNLSIGGVQETGWAGEINWLLKTPNSAGQVITTYRADLFDDAKIPTQLGTFETTAAVDLDKTLSHGAVPNAGSMAAYLVNTNAGDAHKDTSGIRAAGLQIAIWQAMFGADSFSVLNTTQGYTAIMGVVTEYLHGLPSHVSSTAGYFDVVNDVNQTGRAANGQDQIATPEPATVLLLMLAVPGMFCYQYRLKRRAVGLLARSQVRSSQFIVD
jgi:hypothetical protein